MIATGFRMHLGWANAVSVESTGGVVRFVDRRDVDLAAHGAHSLFGEEQEDARDRLELAMTDSLAEFAVDLPLDVGGIVVTRDAILRIPVEKIVASSSLYHTAAGALHQRALHAAFARLGLPCTTIRFDEAEEHTSSTEVAALGASAGRPWRKDHRFAAVAALHALGLTSAAAP